MTQPDRKQSWEARNAWRCILVLIVFELIITQALRIATRESTLFANWISTYPYLVLNARKVFRAGVWLFIAYRFARVKSTTDFVEKVGLARRPTLLGWCGACLAISIGFLNLYGVTNGWTSSNRVVRELYTSGGEALLFNIVIVLSVTPFFEEVVLRGFLYQAFRGSYGQILSTLLVLSTAAYFHWSAVSSSLYTLACLIAIWILLCVMRERTGNIWNCVLCHAAYNASVSVNWPVYVAALLVLLPYCMRRAEPHQKVEKPAE